MTDQNPTATDPKPRRPPPAAIRAGFDFPDAFALYHYRCANGHSRRIWNSRDGCVPFMIACPQRGCEASAEHVAWQHDLFDPLYQPRRGEHIFRDLTPREASDYAWRKVNGAWDDASYPLKEAGGSFIDGWEDAETEEERKAVAAEYFATKFLEDSCSRCHQVEVDDDEAAALEVVRQHRANDTGLRTRLQAVGYRGEPIPHRGVLEVDAGGEASPLELLRQARNEAVASILDDAAHAGELEPRRELRVLLPSRATAGKLRLFLAQQDGPSVDLELRWDGDRITGHKLHQPKDPLAAGDIRIRVDPADPEGWAIQEPR